jgi:aldehyde dehydrogenase (NAD+)
MGYIEAGKEAGATVHAGGDRLTSEAYTDGYYVQPTIFTDTTPDMKIVKEEIFGPVSVVTKFKTEEEVIEWANDTTYGLASGIFTQNINRAIRVSNALEAGSAWVNCYHSFENMMPFGGYKMSGIGRELGTEVFEAYVDESSPLLFNLVSHVLCCKDTPG